MKDKKIRRGIWSALRHGVPVFRRRQWVVASAVLIAFLLLFALVVSRTHHRPSGAEAFWRRTDSDLLTLFMKEPAPGRETYEELFSYFITGFLSYRNRDLSSAAFPGASSTNGERVDAMEGFTRILPLVGAWIASGRDRVILTRDGSSVDLLELAKAGLIAGTDHRSGGYWGQIKDFDQKICEAADVALSIWLLRDALWKRLDQEERERIVQWLLGVDGRRIPDNNWHLFPVMIYEVLRSLGYRVDRRLPEEHYGKLKGFYKGDGWFSDGPKGIFDYYNAWGTHYTLYWLNVINPDLDPAFIHHTLKEFVGNYQYFFSPSGTPIMGRSICYRMATPAPLVAGAMRNPRLTNPGIARRALDLVWRHFILSGGVAQGNITQGYCGEDLRFLDNYSGPASCLWSLRSLVLALSSPSTSAFWRSPSEKLPVEVSDYEVPIPTIGWKVVGEKSRGEVRLVRLSGEVKGGGEIQGHNALRRAVAKVTGRPFRPRNDEAKYGLPEYSALEPFCGCAN